MGLADAQNRFILIHIGAFRSINLMIIIKKTKIKSIYYIILLSIRKSE